MAGNPWWWYLLAGIGIGWTASTLAEWLWFRKQRAGQPTYRDQSPGYSSLREDWRDARGPATSRPLREERGDARGPEERPAPRPPQEDRGDERRPEERAAPRPVEPPAARPPAGTRRDRLTEIRGIGPTYQQRLYDAGLFTWQQIAQQEPETLRQLTQALPTSDPQNWIEQARRLAQGS